MYSTLLAVLLCQAVTPSAGPVLENDYVQVFRNSAPCAAAGPSCGERVLVALGPLELARQKMKRGDFKVFKQGERYTAPNGGDFAEVMLKPAHPKVKTPPVSIAPDKNSLLYDGPTFFIYEENLQPGDTRVRHSHNQRVGILLNETRLQQWPEGQPEFFKDIVPDAIQFFEPVVHVIKNVGKNPLRNWVLEFKP
jgi:hypothetical protein